MVAEHMRPERRILAMGLGALLLLPACAEEPRPKPIRPVRAVQVGQTGAFVGGRSLPGRAKATQEANLAFEVAGLMTERVDVGVEVESGELLARLDPRDHQNMLDRANAERDRARAHRDRIKIAADAGAVPKQDLTDAQARYNQAAATVNIRQKAVDDTHIFAPFGGTVAATYVEPFENVVAKQAVLRVLDTTKIEMIVNVPETAIGNAPYVKEITVRFDAIKDREFSAEIKEISNEASETTRTYPVTIIMDNPPDAGIQPGMAGEASARIEIPGGQNLRYEVPIGAVFSPNEGKDAYVWIVDEGAGTVSRRAVQVGEATPRGVAILSGVTSGDWIVTAGVDRLVEGQQVRLLE